MIFDADGRFVKSWGKEFAGGAHGMCLRKEDGGEVLYLTHLSRHELVKTTLDGEVLWALGYPEMSGIYQSKDQYHPTSVAVGPNGDLYVADGYGNARVHHYDPDRNLLQSWGAPGTGPGQFNLPHSVWVHTDGRVFVCDRENDRIQIFSPSGELLSTWTNVTRPGDLYIDRDERVYVGEMAWDEGESSLSGRRWPETRPAQLSIRDLEGNVLAGWGGPDPCAPGSFASPHGLWVDSRGDIYVGEVTHTALSRYGRWHPGCHTLQKFARAAGG
jgi:NHL repeat